MLLRKVVSVSALEADIVSVNAIANIAMEAVAGITAMGLKMIEEEVDIVVITMRMTLKATAARAKVKLGKTEKNLSTPTPIEEVEAVATMDPEEAPAGATAMKAHMGEAVEDIITLRGEESLMSKHIRSLPRISERLGKAQTEKRSKCWEESAQELANYDDSFQPLSS